MKEDTQWHVRCHTGDETFTCPTVFRALAYAGMCLHQFAVQANADLDTRKRSADTARDAGRLGTELEFLRSALHALDQNRAWSDLASRAHTIATGGAPNVPAKIAELVDAINADGPDGFSMWQTKKSPDINPPHTI